METRGRPRKTAMRISRKLAIFVLVALVALASLVAVRALRRGPTDEERIPPSSTTPQTPWRRSDPETPWPG